MSRAARFRQIDLTRAIRAAKATGARVVVRPDGWIEIDPTAQPELSPQSTPDPRRPVAPAKDFVL